MRARTVLGARPDLPKLSPASFALAVSPGFKLPAHLDLLDRAIVETIATGGRLIVSMPPRHGKSELGSRFAPAWFVGRYPDRRVMLTSFDAELAASFGRRSRDLLKQYGRNLFGVVLRADSAAADRWDLAGRKGGMLTAGIGGSITGRGADLLIIDDPVRSIEDAASETMREKTSDWFRGTALTRLEPGAAVIVIMTRWHEDDLAGRILENDAGDWRVLRLPAFAEEDDPLGRLPGEALWPERYPVADLEQKKQQMGNWLFSAEYQQEPIPAEGQTFKAEWIRHWRPVSNDAYDLGGRVVLRKDCQHLVTCDLAVSTRNTSDYTVIAVWAVAPGSELILIDLIRRRMEAPDIVPALKRIQRLYAPYAIGIESTGYQLAIPQYARREGLDVMELHADKDKCSRASAAAMWMEAGKVYFPADSDYLESLESEILSFPAGKHDDQVDALGYAVAEVAKRNADWSIAYAPAKPREERASFDCQALLASLRALGATTRPL